MTEVITTDPASNYGLDRNDQGLRQPILLMCGRTVGTDAYCNRPVQLHPYLPNAKHYVVKCDRNDTTPETSDFYLTFNNAVIPYVEFSGNEAKVESLINRTWSEDTSGTIIDEHNYISVDIEHLALERWRDVAPDVVTVTLAQHLARPDVTEALMINGTFTPLLNQVSEEVRNAYVEGNEGFISRKFLDSELTRKYHDHLLNVYLDKQGDIAIGSIRLVKTVDHWIEARCVQSSCASRMAINPVSATREDMETFILAIIRHGNNHAAKWFRNKTTKKDTRTNSKSEFVPIEGTTRKVITGFDEHGDPITTVGPVYKLIQSEVSYTSGEEVTRFYKVHDSNCILDKCNQSEAGCRNLKPKVTNSQVEPNPVQFLLEHQTYCNDPKCKCDERLRELAPILV